jgi:hypothetical protein
MPSLLYEDAIEYNALHITFELVDETLQIICCPTESSGRGSQLEGLHI